MDEYWKSGQIITTSLFSLTGKSCLGSGKSSPNALNSGWWNIIIYPGKWYRKPIEWTTMTQSDGKCRRCKKIKAWWKRDHFLEETPLPKPLFWVCFFQMLKHLSLKLNPPLIGGLEHLDYCSIQLGISWSQLTSCPSFFRGVSSNHQPVIVDQALGVWGTVPTVTTEWILPIAQRSTLPAGGYASNEREGRTESWTRLSTDPTFSHIQIRISIYYRLYLITIKFSIYKKLHYIYYIYIYTCVL